MDAEADMGSNDSFMHFEKWPQLPEGKEWAAGRRVAIRPDHPGHRFRPEDAYILTSDSRKELAAVALNNLYEQSRSGEVLPEWLAEPLPSSAAADNEQKTPEEA